MHCTITPLSHTYVHTYIYTYTYTYIHTHTHTHINIMYVRTYESHFFHITGFTFMISSRLKVMRDFLTNADVICYKAAVTGYGVDIRVFLPVHHSQSYFLSHTHSDSQPFQYAIRSALTLILRRSRTGTVWFYTSTSNKRAVRPKLYTKSLTRDLKLMYSRLKLVRISINL